MTETLSRRATAFDAALAGGLALTGVRYASNGLDPPIGHSILDIGDAMLLAGLAAAPLALRRRYPLLTLGLVTAGSATLLGTSADLAFVGCLLLGIAIYSAAAYGPHRRATLVALPPAAALLVLLVRNAALPDLPRLWIGALVLVPIGVAAAGIRVRRRLADTEARERTELARQAVERERARIARELHDVVTHHVSMMVIQAGAARTVLRAAPGDAVEALLAVESTGRTALNELRDVLGVLGGEPEARLRPQPGLAEMPGLVARLRDAGVAVRFEVLGEPRAVPEGIGLTAYRVAQEALTNTLKHAAGADAAVVVEYQPGQLRVEVTDAGSSPPTSAAAGGHVTALRVVIADDHRLVRTGFRLILGAAGIDVVAEAATGVEAVAAVRGAEPDVVLMDIRMPELDGLAATRELLDGADQPFRVVILTTFDLDEYVYAALRAGASGFLLKDIAPEQLVTAVRTVRAGDALLAPAITRRLVERYARRGESPLPLPREAQRLSPRELEVLKLVANGLNNAEIAARLYLSEATVKTHIARLLAKLNLRDRVQAVVYAYETGIARGAFTGFSGPPR